MLKLEADALRREVNEWRDRAGLPRVDEPARGDGFAMVITGELEVIQGIAIEEEDEDAEDGYGPVQPAAMPGMPHNSQQQAQPYNSYMDDVEEEVAMLGAMYAQQQTGDIHPVHLAQQRQVQLQHTMMAPQPHDLEDPRMTAMLFKNPNPFAQNNSQVGYPTVDSRSPTYTNGAANWVPSQVAGFATGAQFTPSGSHGLPGNDSASGSPVGGVSANGTNAGSPASTTSSLSSFSGGSPLSVVPSHHPGFRRERSGSLTGSSPGSQSPAYELHHAMQDFAGVPRMAGMCGASFVPSHHHMHAPGHGMQPQALSVGGGANALMMMMV